MSVSLVGTGLSNVLTSKGKVMKLKIWNGRVWNADRTEQHLYVCAKSRAALVRMMNEHLGYHLTSSEVKNYWSEGSWGNAMEGIEPEIGIWETRGINGKPKRLV